MKQFQVKQLLAIQSILHQMNGYSQHLEESAQETMVSEKMLTGTADVFEVMLTEVMADMESPMTQILVARVCENFRTDGLQLSLRAFWAQVDEVQSRLFDEFESQGKFFYIPLSRASLFENQEPYGPSVSKKFPRIAEDVGEAFKCYACARYTACVFHLMRVMEHGVQSLGKRLKVTQVETTVWQKILDQVNSAIKTLPAKAERTKKIAEISAHLYSVKLAWRNEVMHPKSTYTEEEAENLLRQVGLFMAELAKVV
jgi:hypothetical protein